MKSKPLLTPEQIKAIDELDALLHPPTMANFLQTGSRDGWAELAAYMEELKKLKTVTVPVPKPSRKAKPTPPTA